MRYTHALLLTPTTAVALPGDANGDGKVDVNDLTIVLAHFGQTGMTWSQGEFTGDGTVDINDLTIVLANYQTAGAGVAAVPEPFLSSAAGLSGLFACALLKRQIRLPRRLQHRCGRFLHRRAAPEGRRGTGHRFERSLDGPRRVGVVVAEGVEDQFPGTSSLPGGGSSNGIVFAWSTLNKSRIVSPLISSPCSSTSISSPNSCTPRQRTNRSSRRLATFRCRSDRTSRSPAPRPLEFPVRGRSGDDERPAARDRRRSRGARISTAIPFGRQVPIEPGDFVVLAIGVVVALLGVADFVAGHEHRHPLREEQRGQEVSLLLSRKAGSPDRRCAPRRRSSS